MFGKYEESLNVQSAGSKTVSGA